MIDIPNSAAEDKRRAVAEIESSLTYMRRSGASKKKIAHNEQRLAEARAVAGMPPIVTLDDVTPDAAGASATGTPPGEQGKGRAGASRRAGPDTVPPASPIRLLGHADLAAEPKRKYLIKGLVSEYDVGCVFGAPSAGKSVITPYLAYRFAQELPVFGHKTRGGPVFYISAEDRHGMRSRFEALHRTYGAADNFKLVDPVSSMLDPDQFNAVAALIVKHKPRLIIVDTVAAAFSGIDENSAKDMSLVKDKARAMTAYGAAVILVHHTAKAAGSDTPRGSGILNGDMDMTLHLGDKDNAGIIRALVIKNRSGPGGAKLAFRIEGIVTGQDEDGDDETAPVMQEVANAPAAPAKLPRGAGYALENLSLMMAASGGGESVALDDWRDKCIADHRISPSEDRDTRRKAFQRAHNDLVDARRIRHEAGQVFLSLDVPADDSKYAGIPPDYNDIP